MLVTHLRTINVYKIVKWEGILPNSFYLRREASFTERFFGPRGRQAAMPGLQLGTVQSVHRTVHTEIAGRAQLQCTVLSYQGTC